MGENGEVLSSQSTAGPWQSLQHTPEVVVEERARTAQLQVELGGKPSLVTGCFVRSALQRLFRRVRSQECSLALDRFGRGVHSSHELDSWEAAWFQLSWDCRRA